ncbi:MAG: sulfotransferase [Rhodopila sp.]
MRVFPVFSKLFARDQQLFCYDLREIGRYFRTHEILMAHWHDVLPQDVLLKVRYEDLVNDFPTEARRIVILRSGVGALRPGCCALFWMPWRTQARASARRRCRATRKTALHPP